MAKRVYVVGAYIPNGGTHMAYHLARILEQRFGYEGIAVTVADERPDHGVFDYAPVFPAVGLPDLAGRIGDDDLLIANPSFSPLCLGLTCKGRKIMYVQDFKTFDLLDLRFDLYVSVSGFVQDFLGNVYGIATPVVAPFIRADAALAARPWIERPEQAVLVSNKGDSRRQRVLFARLQEILAADGVQPRFDFLPDGKVSHAQLMRLFADYRYFLSLSPAEGFGLMPLEAMAMGALAVGFDAYGGRDYFRTGENCLTSRFPDIEGVAALLAQALADDAGSEKLARAGRRTASSPAYGLARFESDWTTIFTDFLGR